LSVPFEKADPETRRVFLSVFYNVLVNLNAVKMGLYDKLLCETDDPLAGLRWKEDMPKVIQAMKERKERGY
jgi:hypothetical protein